MKMRLQLREGIAMAPHQWTSEASYKHAKTARRGPSTLAAKADLDPLDYVTKSLGALLEEERLGLSIHGDDNRVMTRWLDWIRAYERLIARCEQQQKLETVLFAAKSSTEVTCCASEEIDGCAEFRRAKHAEEIAANDEEELALLLWDSRAGSVSGIVAKLFAVLKKGEPSEDHSEFPWPQIRSVLVDLLYLEKTRPKIPDR
jgi:hypothetical protein